MSGPTIADYDPAWAAAASDQLDAISAALAGLPEAAVFRFDHIGSTSVPGLAAKPILDLMVRMPRIPSEDATAGALAPLGLRRARGSRPDSPGVDSDIPRPRTDQDPALYVKQLFHRPTQTRSPEVVLHIRRLDSPFAEFVIEFRDWLRADSGAAARYAAVKRALALEYADAADYDDYTRAKTIFMDEAQAEIERRRTRP